MNREAAVSVVIPTYNSAATIIQSIESVIKQTYQRVEIIVVDDGSTDNTKELIGSYIENGKVVYIYQENKGCGAARNAGTAEARGEYIAFLDADDYWDPEKIAKQIAILEANPQCVVSYTESKLLDSQGNITLPKRTFFQRQRSGYVLPFFVFHNIVTLSSAIIRKKTFMQIGGFTEEKDLMMFADLDLWLRTAPIGKFIALAEPLTYYRTRSDIDVGKIKKNYKYITKIFKSNISRAHGFTKVFYVLGYFRIKILGMLTRVSLLRTIKKIGFKGVIKELRRRTWLQIEFLWYPILFSRLSKLHRTVPTNEQLFDFVYKHSFGILVLGQIESEIRKFLDIARVHKPRVVMEIGTANGGNLFLLANITASHGKIISLDLPGGDFGGGYFSRKQKVFKAFPNPDTETVLLRGDSHAQDSLNFVKKKIGDSYIDLLFIDGDHTYEGVKKDFEMYGPLVRPGGIIAFHDIANPPAENYGTKKFWDEIKQQYSSEEIIENPSQQGYGIGVITK